MLKHEAPSYGKPLEATPLQPNLTTALDHHLEPILALAQIA